MVSMSVEIPSTVPVISLVLGFEFSRDNEFALKQSPVKRIYSTDRISAFFAMSSPGFIVAENREYVKKKRRGKGEIPKCAPSRS